jgi:hypothetical protein
MKRAYFDGSRRQLGLFQPRLDLPSWRALPGEIRDQTRRLLAQILTEAMGTRKGEVGSEGKVRR